MLSCRQLATLASHYLDQDATARLKWQMRLHLLMCSNCRRFMRHLGITQTLAVRSLRYTNTPIETDVDAILARIKQREQHTP